MSQVEAYLVTLLRQIVGESQAVIEKHIGKKPALLLIAFDGERIKWVGNVANETVAQICDFVAADAKKISAEPVIPETLHEALH